MNLKPKEAQNQLPDGCGQAVSLVFAQHVPGTQPAFRSRDLDRKIRFLSKLLNRLASELPL